MIDEYISSLYKEHQNAVFSALNQKIWSLVVTMQRATVPSIWLAVLFWDPR